MTAAKPAAPTNPPAANKADSVFSSDDREETSILGSIAHTLDLPSWSTDTPRSMLELVEVVMTGGSSKSVLMATRDVCLVIGATKVAKQAMIPNNNETSEIPGHKTQEKIANTSSLDLTCKCLGASDQQEKSEEGETSHGCV